MVKIMQNIKIGLYSGKLKSGPETFFVEFKKYLLRKEFKIESKDPDIWVQPIFKRIPFGILVRIFWGKTKLILRADGCYNIKLFRLNVLNFLINIFFNRWIFVNTYLPVKKLVVYQSEFSKKINFSHIGKVDNYKVIKNGSNWNLGEAQVSRRRPIMGSVQFMKPKKRAHLLPNLLRKLNIQKGSCILIGEIHSSIKNHLTVYFPSNGSLQTILVQQQENTQVRNIVNRFKIYISLSYEDPCPNAILESSRLQIPIVATKAGGHSELLFDKSLVVEDLPDETKYVPHFSLKEINISAVNNYLENIHFALKLNGYVKHPFSDRTYSSVFDEYIESSLDEI